MRALLSVAVASVALAVVACGGRAEAEADGEHLRSGRIEYAVDGDTLRVRLAAGDLLYVRLIGRLSRVSAPALRHPAVASGIKERLVGLLQSLFQ